MEARVELRRDAGRLGPHTGPWIRRKQIARIQGSPDPHGLAHVLDRKGDTLGWGLISPVSAITVRMLCFTEEPPPTDWLTGRLEAAFSARAAYRFDEEGTNGYREVNSEGDGLPGLVIDRYDEDLVVQITTAPMVARRDPLVEWLRHRWKGRIHVLLPEAAAKQEGFDAALDRDEDTPTLVFKEHGLRFETPAPPAQKTGAYFDQRGNRRVVAHLARRHGGRLLDVGCHVGGFALHARHLGVPALGFDQSNVALQYAKGNAASNGMSDVQWVRGDMFKPWDDPELRGPFGTIVLDPPKIASRKSDVDRAVSAMGRLAANAAARLESGGHLVLCSCSHHIGREHLDRVVASLPQVAPRRSWTRVATLGAGFDHPVMPGHREGEYLRVNVYQVR
jgi:23S rRNA (cytosine1962-C5)-methyltransferase